jgi:hypothetical protein
MTSATDIERDLNDLSEDILAELEPSERARLAARLRAAGEHDRLHDLREAAPVKTYDVMDLEFLAEERELRAEALYALWELETGVWRFLYEQTSGQLREANYRQFPDEEWTEEPTEENEFHEQQASRQAALFLVDYQAWRRYATDDVGISLREFLLHPLESDAGAEHVDRIELMAKLADGRAFDGADGWASDTALGDSTEELVSELTESKYQSITTGANEARGDVDD